MFFKKKIALKRKIVNAIDNTDVVCFNAELNRVLNALENDMQKTIYLDWWNGGSIWFNETKSNGKTNRAKRYVHVNDNDWEMATGYIMETISNGMG